MGDCTEKACGYLPIVSIHHQRGPRAGTHEELAMHHTELIVDSLFHGLYGQGCLGSYAPGLRRVNSTSSCQTLAWPRESC